MFVRARFVVARPDNAVIHGIITGPCQLRQTPFLQGLPAVAMSQRGGTLPQMVHLMGKNDRNCADEQFAWSHEFRRLPKFRVTLRIPIVA